LTYLLSAKLIKIGCFGTGYVFIVDQCHFSECDSVSYATLLFMHIRAARQTIINCWAVAFRRLHLAMYQADTLSFGDF